MEQILAPKKNTKATATTEKAPKDKISVSLDTIMKAGVRLPDALDQIECVLIYQAIKHCDGNQTRAADLLGINRTTFVMKLRNLRNFGINADDIGALSEKFGYLFE